MKFPESKLAHKYLDGLLGIEVGSSSHNSFGIPNCKNVDYTDDMTTIFKLKEIELCGEAMPVDIVANGDCLPLADESLDYVISSHVIEHFFDPIKAIEEWLRVIRVGGYIFTIVPHKDRTFDSDKECTTLHELIERHNSKMNIPSDDHKHWCIWTTETFKELIDYMELEIVEYLDVDDKVGNGFCFVIRKDK
jgi:ubiquinone/menaquinone biosynthesis C-methylase UbiE